MLSLAESLFPVPRIPQIDTTAMPAQASRHHGGCDDEGLDVLWKRQRRKPGIRGRDVFHRKLPRPGLPRYTPRTATCDGPSLCHRHAEIVALALHLLPARCTRKSCTGSNACTFVPHHIPAVAMPGPGHAAQRSPAWQRLKIVLACTNERASSRLVTSRPLALFMCTACRKPQTARTRIPALSGDTLLAQAMQARGEWASGVFAAGFGPSHCHAGPALAPVEARFPSSETCAQMRLEAKARSPVVHLACNPSCRCRWD